MVTNLYEKFLENQDDYEKSQEHWKKLWDEVISLSSKRSSWRTPWMGTGGDHIKDGNPIFCAISQQLRRAVRIIQLEPCEPGLDFQVWLNETEDDPWDPENSQEMVIACVLSDVAGVYARTFLEAWVNGSALLLMETSTGALTVDRAMKREKPSQYPLGDAA